MLLSRMVGDHASSLSLLTTFSLPLLMGVEVINSLSVQSEDILWTQSLSEPGLVLSRDARLLVVAESGFGTGMGPETAWEWDLEEWEWE